MLIPSQRVSDKLSIVFKEYDITATESTGRSGELRVWPTQIILHAKFDYTKFVNDIALIRFEPKLNFVQDPLVSPACLPQPGVGNKNKGGLQGSSLDGGSYAHVPATVAGWGKISEGNV
jgi:hypothetical protein